MAKLRSTPEMGGPLTNTHKQGWPKTLIAVQQESFGGIGLKGTTDARQGISWTNAEKNVLPQGNPIWKPCVSHMIHVIPKPHHTSALLACLRKQLLNSYVMIDPFQ
ncbi:hypothetical protein E3N88_14145 [Mikania micrantha]|uniref:Uncharacterized protein n=1 Tax=Mikania micrantha TaxID=192012 RepID=A0A5N6P3Q3_9ASTR|nr:hypothetical protein E3N88_14145 [Mikania micrantha]